LYGVYFAKKVKEKDVARMYTSGLLHNVGELAILRVTPSIAKQCNRLSPEVLPRQCQEEVLGFSYAEVSASLLQRWLIPDSLVSTVAMQHHDDAPAVTVESQIIQLSYSLAVVQTYPDLYLLSEQVPEFLFSSLKLELDDLSDAIASCQPEFEALSAIFKAH